LVTYFTWATLPFGKHKGKTLPQVILHDPDWFYWAHGNSIFKSAILAEQASEVADKASRIRIPKPDPENWRIKYIIRPEGKFEDFLIVPLSQVHAEYGNCTFGTCLDLFVPGRHKRYDKFGYKLLLAKFKQYWFCGENLTKERCERFFIDEQNFVPR
jgi:hypothetical protein